MAQYYYLISSLYDVILKVGEEEGGAKRIHTLNEFIEFCSEQLTEADFESLKQMFLFNDIRNALNFKKEGDDYITPSYYSKEEFLENIKDTDLFLPFLAEYFYNRKNEKRLHLDLKEVDEVALLFYENLDSINNPFLKDYFLFELDLQNITTALSMRKEKLEYNTKIIPFGDNYYKILIANSADFGLAGDIPYLNKLLDVYEGDDLTKIEKTIEDIRWDWLDEQTVLSSFSEKAVFAYGVKLLSVERWKQMSDEKGNAVLNELIEKIKSSIKFSDEFITVGGKK